VLRVYAIVPVAPFEPESIITKSIESLKELGCDDFDLKIYYVIDTFHGDERKLHWSLPDNFTIMLRTPRGRKAGAINDVLSVIKNENADYIAIIDVDWKPAKDFITKCIAALEKDDSAVHATAGCRFGVNKSNTLTKIISNNLSFFTCDVYRHLTRPSGFTATNIGVVKRSFLDGEKFDEMTSAEDLDFFHRICLKGKVAVLADTAIGEHAPTTLKELYHQRVRWYKGCVESVSKYFIPMVKAPIPFARKMSWFSQGMLFFCGFLLTPLVISQFISHFDKIKKQSSTSVELVKIFCGSLCIWPFMTICGLVAIVKHLTLCEFEWKPTTRIDA